MISITWTKCSEALPDDDESVLIACDDGEVQVGFLDAGTWRYQDAMPLELHGVSVTHWADLPAHPDDQRARPTGALHARDGGDGAAVRAGEIRRGDG